MLENKNRDVSKRMLHKELRPYYFPMKFFAALLSKKWSVKLINSSMNFTKGKTIKSLHCEERFISSNNEDPDIRIRIFRPKSVSKNLPAMLYMHGGGYMIGTPEIALDIIQQFIETRPCVVIAPDYRKSIKTPYPAGFNDCYNTLLWMKENASSIGIHPSKFIVAGHSAGGGLAAAVALKARDTKDVDIAFQMPVYPMIDHRQNTESAKNMHSVPVWNGKANALGWRLYLRDIKGEIPYYASPALNKNYKNLPPTITFVGSLEPFKDETTNYVEALKKENIPVKFELFEGAFHAFETIANKTAIGRKANHFQLQAYAEYFDKYIVEAG